jgi:glutamate synthase (NADPH/NADH) small chain
VRCLSIFDEQGRFAPRYDDSDTQVHPAALIVEAIGQAADTSCLGLPLTESLEWNRNRIRIDADGRTSEPWLWSAGDMVRGPDVVSAVADGHRVAASIDAVLSAKEESV